MLRTRELTDLVRTGVPVKYRSEIWMVFSGSVAEVSICVLVLECAELEYGMCELSKRNNMLFLTKKSI